MTSCYEEIDEDLLRKINLIRENIAYDSSKELLARKDEFVYHGNNYSIISIIPDMPELQLLINYSEGIDINKSFMVVGSYYCEISKKGALKEINNIRKYNGKVRSTKCTLIPKYDTTLSVLYLETIKEMIKAQANLKHKILMYAYSKRKLSACDTFVRYVNTCNIFDEKRKEPKKVKKRKLVRVI